MQRITLTFIIILLASGVLAHARCNSSSACGQPLATYPILNGATAYSNSPDQGTGTSCAGRDKYQCVEYIKRFYSTVLGISSASSWTGNAIDYFFTAADKNLIPYPNGGVMPPLPNDILVFEGGVYGHVAIVTSTSSSQIQIIEQNWSPTGQASLAVVTASGTTTVMPRGHYSVLGWLRPAVASSNRTAVQFSGTVTAISDPNQVLPQGALTSGVTVAGFFSYDPTVASSSSLNGAYNQVGLDTGIFITLIGPDGPLTFSTPSPPFQYSLFTYLNGNSSTLALHSIHLAGPAAFADSSFQSSLEAILFFQNNQGPPFLNSLALPTDWNIINLTTDQPPDALSELVLTVDNAIVWSITFHINALKEIY